MNIPPMKSNGHYQPCTGFSLTSNQQRDHTTKSTMNSEVLPRRCIAQQALPCLMPARYLDVTTPFHCYLEYSSALQPCFLPSSSYQFSVSATAPVYYFLIPDIDCPSALFACRVNKPQSIRRWDKASRSLLGFRGVPNHSSTYKLPVRPSGNTEPARRRIMSVV